MGAPTLLDGKEREAQEIAGEGVIEVDGKLVTEAPQAVVERGPVDVELLAGGVRQEVGPPGRGMPLPGARRGDDPERGLGVHSREDGERILADLAASGLTEAAFSRLPGSPSKKSLRAWRGQAERGEPDVPGREVRGRCGHAKHARYPEATRREAASLARGGMRPADVARRLGVSSGGVVASWLRGAAGGGSIAPGKGAVRVDGAAAEARVAEPEAELAEERLRRDAPGELVRDPKAGDPASPSNSQEAGLGERLRRGFGYRLADVLALLGISKSSYEYAGRANERAEARRAEVAGRVRHAFEASRRRCGYRRVGASVLSGSDGLPPTAARPTAPPRGRGRARRAASPGRCRGRGAAPTTPAWRASSGRSRRSSRGTSTGSRAATWTPSPPSSPRTRRRGRASG